MLLVLVCDGWLLSVVVGCCLFCLFLFVVSCCCLLLLLLAVGCRCLRLVVVVAVGSRQLTLLSVSPCSLLLCLWKWFRVDLGCFKLFCLFCWCLGCLFDMIVPIMVCLSLFVCCR